MTDNNWSTDGLIEEANRHFETTSADKLRMAGRLGLSAAAVTTLAVLKASTVSSLGASSSNSFLGMSFSGSFIAKGLATVTLVGAGAWATQRALAPTVIPHAPQVAEFHAEVPSQPAPAREAPPLEQAAPAVANLTDTPLFQDREKTVTRKASPAPPDAAQSIAGELASLGHARAALTSGDAAEALTRIRKHQALFEKPRLAPEAEAIRVLAQCQLGAPGALDAATKFLKRYPASPAGGHVKVTCAIPKTD
ncbi:MAG: hypothetical protein RJA70_4698 [Pseudomonadota bacterium]|jgi:hypothetical protein